MLSPKSFVLSALILSSGLFLAACGQEAEQNTAENETPSAKTSAPDSTAAEPAEAKPAAPDEQEGYALGEPRDDINRFFGVYGDPDNPGRDFFVAPAKAMPGSERQIPPGYIMIGAMWGDVAPWYMKSLSDTRFEQQWVGDFGTKKVVVFEIGDDGKAVAMTFKESTFKDRGRLERLRDLPEDWK